MAARSHGAEESKSAAGRRRAAAAGPPALPPPDAHVRALSAAHAEKTKSLLKSIDRLKAEISTLRAANKEHHRSAHIRALQRRLREQELVSDVLKQSLQSASSMSAADVDDLVIRKTVAGPLRFRPKSREELANEVRALAQANDALRTRLSTARAARPAPPPPAGADAAGASPGDASAHADGGSSLPSLPGAGRASQGLDGGPSTTSDVGLLRAAAALGAEGDAAALREETAHLRTAVESREALLGRQASEIEELERRVDQLTEFEDKARRLARKYLRVKAEAAALAADRCSSRGLTEEAELSSRRLRDRAAVLQAENADLSERLRREVAQRGTEAAAAEAEATALRRRAELAERAAEQAVSASGTRLSDLETELGKVRSDRADLESRLIQASIDLRQSESKRETAEANAERSGSLVEEQRDALAALRKAEAEARNRLQRAEHALAEALRDAADARRAGDAEGTQGAAERGRAEAAERRSAALESELNEAEAEGRRWRASASMLRRQMVAARQLYRQESRRAAGLEALLEGRGPEGEEAASERREREEEALRRAAAAAAGALGESVPPSRTDHHAAIGQPDHGSAAGGFSPRSSPDHHTVASRSRGVSASPTAAAASRRDARLRDELDAARHDLAAEAERGAELADELEAAQLAADVCKTAADRYAGHIQTLEAMLQASVSPVHALEHHGDDDSGDDDGGGGGHHNAAWKDDQAEPDGEVDRSDDNDDRADDSPAEIPPSESVDPFADDEDFAEAPGSDGANPAAPPASVDPFADEDQEGDAEGSAGAAATESVDPFADEDDVADFDADADAEVAEPSTSRPPRHAGAPAPVAESSGAGFELSQSTAGGDDVDGGPSWAQLSADD